MYTLHFKNELCTTFKRTTNEDLTDLIAQALNQHKLFTATNDKLLLIGVRKEWAIEITKSAQKISSLIAKHLQRQGAH